MDKRLKNEKNFYKQLNLNVKEQLQKYRSEIHREITRKIKQLDSQTSFNMFFI